MSKIPLTKRKVLLHILLRVVTCGLFHVKLVRSLQYHINVCYCINEVDSPIHALHQRALLNNAQKQMIQLFFIQPVAVSVTRQFNKHVSIFAIQSKNLRFNTFA